MIRTLTNRVLQLFGWNDSSFYWKACMVPGLAFSGVGLFFLTVSNFFPEFLTSGPIESMSKHYSARSEIRPFILDRVAFNFHIAIAILSTLAGLYQLHPMSRKGPRLHIYIGPFYVLLGFVTCLTGVILSKHSLGGGHTQPAMYLMAIGWGFTTAMALKALFLGKMRDHRDWFVRSFFLLTSNFYSRVYVVVIDELFPNSDPGVVFSNAIWGSLLTAVVASEVIIHRAKYIQSNRSIRAVKLPRKKAS